MSEKRDVDVDGMFFLWMAACAIALVLWQAGPNIARIATALETIAAKLPDAQTGNRP